MTTVASPPSAPAPRPAPKRRGRYIVAIGGCVIAVVAIIVLAVVLSENVVYFRTVTEAVHNRKDEGTSRFRRGMWRRHVSKRMASATREASAVKARDLQPDSRER